MRELLLAGERRAVLDYLNRLSEKWRAARARER
jgi:hypothetical protein